MMLERHYVDAGIETKNLFQRMQHHGQNTYTFDRNAES